MSTQTSDVQDAQQATEGIEYSAWEEWDPRDYNREYYSEITLDGQYLMEWVVECVQKAPPMDVALEFGSGPTVLHTFPLIKKTKEIHLAEYLQVNREEVQRWVNKEGDTHDWSQFTREFLRMEGNQSPSDAEVEAREEQVRQAITQVMHADAGEENPLGADKRGFYPLVTALCCADSATNDKDTWRLYMKNIASLVKPGGMLVISACGGHDFYRVGERRFPGACVSGRDMLNCLQELGFGDIDLRLRQVPDSAGQGFSTTILARAIKPE